MIYVTGDTHGNIKDFDYRVHDNDNNEFSIYSHIFMEDRKDFDFKEGDYLIICGDFGFDWDENSIKLWNMTPRKFTTLFCDGNHENYDILNSLPLVEKFGDVVGDFGNNTYRLLTGHMYTIEGKKFFVFGGAASIDKDWRVEENAVRRYGKIWWKEEVPTDKELELAEKTLEKNNYEFDYFISHTCRYDLKKSVLDTYKADFFDPTEVMIDNLERLVKDKGKDWKASYFGHFHMNKDYGKYHCLYEKIVPVDN